MGEEFMAGRSDARGIEAAEHARKLYLDEDHRYGCAESVFIALKTAYGLDRPDDAAPAMVLNGGVAYSGGPCGAVTGAALALGMLAEERLDDHLGAKRVARELVAETMEAFESTFGAADCRTLTGYDLREPGGHQAFLESDVWRDACVRQIEFVVGRLAGLADEVAWADAIRGT